jgi:adenylosuccinate lyase
MADRQYEHDTFLSPFTWRYGSEEMRAIWSEVHKRRLWRRVWVALAAGQHEAGLVTCEVTRTKWTWSALPRSRPRSTTT